MTINAMSNAGEQTFRDTGSTNSGFQTTLEKMDLFYSIIQFWSKLRFFGNLSAINNADANSYNYNFQYSVPSNYYSINSKNLAEYGGYIMSNDYTTISDPSKKIFKQYLYTVIC